MLAAILVSGHAAGTETASEEARLGDLLNLLDNETELATRSGMNADFVPGMATIRSGADMLMRGARVRSGRRSRWFPASAKGSR